MTPIELALLKSDSGRKEIKRQDLIVNVTEQIWAAMEAAGVSKADLARALNTSKSNITQLLSGSRNLTLSTLADIASALNVSPDVRLAPVVTKSAIHRQRLVVKGDRVELQVVSAKQESASRLTQAIILPASSTTFYSLSDERCAVAATH